MLVIKAPSTPSRTSQGSDATAGQKKLTTTLRLNQVCSAQVIRQMSNGVELQLGHGRLQAKTKLPLDIGQLLELQVISLGDQIELKLLKKQDLGAQNLLPLFRSGGLAETMQKLSGQASDEQGVPRAFWTQVAHLLSRFEHSPEDLRGWDIQSWSALIRRLKEKAFDDPSAQERMNDDGRAAPERQLNSLRFCQARLSENGLQILPLPLPFLEQGYVLLPDEKNQQEQTSKGTMVSLHLELKHLGSLHIDLLLTKGALSLRFLCSNPKTTDLILEHAGLLQQGRFGHLIQNLNIATGGDHPIPTLLAKVLHSEEGMLRVKA